MFSAFNSSKCIHLEQWTADTAAPGEQFGGSVPCSRVSRQSWTIPAGAGIRTHNLGLPRVSSPTLYPLGHNCPRKKKKKITIKKTNSYLSCYCIIISLKLMGQYLQNATINISENLLGNSQGHW